MALPILEYSHAADGPIRRNWLRALFLGVALLAVTAIFLPFYFDVSPWSVAVELFSKPHDAQTMIYLFGMPFFFAIPLALWKIRTLFRPNGSLAECVLAWILFIAATVMSVGVIYTCLAEFLNDTAPRDPEMLLGVISFAIHLAFAFVGSWLVWRRTRSRDALTSAALIGAYLPNAVMCLILFRDDPDIGWWFTLIATGGLFAELVAILSLARRGF